MVTLSKTVAHVFNTPRLYKNLQCILEGLKSDRNNAILSFDLDDPIGMIGAIVQSEIQRFNQQERICVIIYGRNPHNTNIKGGAKFPNRA